MFILYKKTNFFALSRYNLAFLLIKVHFNSFKETIVKDFNLLHKNYKLQKIKSIVNVH